MHDVIGGLTSAAYVPPRHVVLEQEAQAHAARLERFMQLQTHRDIEKFFVPGELYQATYAMLGHAEHPSAALVDKNIILVTGMHTAQGLPQTDGPVASLLLAELFARLGGRVTLVSDPVNADVLAAGLKKLKGPQERVFLATYEGERDHTADPAEEGSREARAFVAATQPDFVLAVEVASRTLIRERTVSGFKESWGPVYDRTGQDVTHVHPTALDDLVLAAGSMTVSAKTGAKPLPLIAVVDGGYQAGMGPKLHTVPQPIVNGQPVQIGSAVHASHMLAGWTASAAANTFAASLCAASGRPQHFPSARHYGDVLYQVGRAGAVDAETGGGLGARGYSVDGYPHQAVAAMHPLLGAFIRL